MYLKIDDNKGYFLKEDNTYEDIDKIGKDDLMRLIDLAVSVDFQMDEFDEEQMRNPAHRIIYKTLYFKFQKLVENKDRFIDESSNLFKEAYQKYNVESSEDSSQPS
jgi:hypothetical protein